METGPNFLFPSYYGKIILTGADTNIQYPIDLKYNQ